MRFLSQGKLGSKRSYTPEGFLVCHDVPIARTGAMTYVDHELPELEATRDGLLNVTRDADVLFHPDTVASFQGKPVVDDHPEEDVTPDNWEDYAVGTVQNVRRGTGEWQDCLLADLLITSARIIRMIEQDEKREVSCGYDADYEQVSPGNGRQLNIVGNHVALVDRGRCGPRCAIGDTGMAVKKRSLLGRIRAAAKSRDAAEMEGALKDAEEVLGGEEGGAGEGGDTHVHVHVGGAAAAGEAPEAGKVEDRRNRDDGEDMQGIQELGARLGALEQTVTTLAEAVAKLVGGEGGEEEDDEEGEVLGDEEPDIEGGKAEDADILGEESTANKETIGDEEAEESSDRRRTGDSALKVEAQRTFANAEILLPGVRFPTVDAKASAKKTRDALCVYRRKVLKRAYEKGGKGRDAIAAALGGTRLNLKTATCDAVATVFNAAAEFGKRANSAPKVGLAPGYVGEPGKSRVDIADLNKKNAEFWARQSGK